MYMYGDANCSRCRVCPSTVRKQKDPFLFIAYCSKMGNGASKKYDAVVLAEATVHAAAANDIPEAIIPSTRAQTFEAKKQAVTLQNWTFTSCSAGTSASTAELHVSFEQVQRIPEKYKFLSGTGENKEVVAIIACTHRKLGGATFTFYRHEPAYRNQHPCDDPTLTKIKEEGVTLYPYAEISITGVSKATYSAHTLTGLKEVYQIQKMGMIKFRCVVVEQAGSDGEGGAVAKAEQSNAIGSKGKIEVSKGCDLMAACSLVILLINANQQAGGGGAAGAM